MKLISWNVNRSSIRRLRRQLDALEDHSDHAPIEVVFEPERTA